MSDNLPYRKLGAGVQVRTKDLGLDSLGRPVHRPIVGIEGTDIAEQTDYLRAAVIELRVLNELINDAFDLKADLEALREDVEGEI